MSSRQKLTVGLVLDTTTKDEGECGRMKDQTDRQTDRIENVCVFMIRKGMVRSTQIRLKARSRKEKLTKKKRALTAARAWLRLRRLLWSERLGPTLTGSLFLVSDPGGSFQTSPLAPFYLYQFLGKICV